MGVRYEEVQYTLVGVKDGKWGEFWTSEDLATIQKLAQKWAAVGYEVRILKTTLTPIREWLPTTEDARR